MTSTSVISGPWRPVDERRHELAESARWLGPGGAADADAFVTVDLLAGRLYTTSGAPGSGLRLLRELDVPLGAVARRGTGWIAAAGQGIAVLDDSPSDAITWLAQPAASQLATDQSAAMRMNDGCADPAGLFWAGVMRYDAEPGAAFLLRVDADGSAHVVLEGLTVPNGPAFSPDGRTLYLADTPTGWIRAFDVDPTNGALGPARHHIHISAGGPDGMTVDAEGCLWSAVWGDSCLHRYAIDGTLLERIEVPAQQPTSVALSSEPPYRIIVTSATHGLVSPDRDDGRVLTAEVAVGGLPAAAFGPRS